MKLLNRIFYIIGSICIMIALYIVADKFFLKDKIIFDRDKELEIINDKLVEIGSPMGWIIIVDGINNQDSNGNYIISYDSNLFDNYVYRQLFVMEYILSDKNNYNKFKVISAFDNSIIYGSPTDDFTLAYMNYDEYNSYYKSLFGEDFDLSNSKKGNSSYDDEYVYYENRRAGSNGVYVPMIQAYNVSYNDEVYTAEAVVTYSTRASELFGEEESNIVIEYIKDINDNIILRSFTLKDS